MPGRQLLFDAVLTVEQPVHRRVHLVGGRRAHIQSAPRVVSAHQEMVANFEAGATARARISAIATRRCAEGGPSSSANPNVFAVTAAAARCP